MKQSTYSEIPTMYESKHLPLSLAQEEDSTNSPLAHQLVIGKLVFELGVFYYQKKTTSLVPLPETPLDEGPGHQVPDILLYDKESERTRVVIEICTSRGFSNDIRKIIRLIEDDDYGILEGFVYNYKTREWMRYRKGDGGAAMPSSYSEVMQVEMSGFV